MDNQTLFNEYCDRVFFSSPRSRTVSREKGRRIVHYLIPENRGEILPPTPNAKAPGPLKKRDFRTMVRNGNYFLHSDPTVGIVNQLRIIDGETVSCFTPSNSLKYTSTLVW
jgi:hypothetical protein